MPRLVFIAPCTDYILGQDGSLSIIKIVDQATVTGVAGDMKGDMNYGAVLFVITSWAKEDDDSDRIFEQRLRLINPSGESVIERFVRFGFAPEATGHYTITRFEDFPIREPGLYMIEIAVRNTGADADWLLCNSHPFRIYHQVSSEQSQS